MKYLNIIAVIIIISATGLNIPTGPFSTSNQHEQFEKQLIRDYPETCDNQELQIASSVSSTRLPTLNPTMGGSWMDTFNDNSAIDWGRSDHINISFGNVKMDFFKADEHTVALWYFDEGSGVTAHDAWPIYNNGTLGGDGLGTDLPTWTAGKHGNALSFDGNDDYVDAGNNDTLNIINNLTIEAWIYPTGWGENGNYGYGRVIDKDKILIYPHRTEFVDYNDYSLVFTLTQGSSNYPSNTPVNSISLDEWQHIAITYDGANVKMYINGISQTLNQPSGSPSGNIDDHLSDHLLIGETLLGNRAFDGIIDELRISNISRVQNTHYANLSSQTINIPTNMCWETLIINKTQAQNTAIEVKILNAANNQQIPGSPKYSGDGEFDISYIDPVQYPSIKLNASFVGKELAPRPILHYWGVSWNRSNVWQDTFFGGLKVDSLSGVRALDGDTGFQNGGYLRSTAVTIPDKQYYDTLTLTKREPAGGSLIVTILDAQTDSSIIGFSHLTASTVDLSTLDPHTYPAIKLLAEFTSTGLRGALQDWSFNWTRNTPPMVQDVTSLTTIHRTKSLTIAINLTDREDAEDELTVQAEYNTPSDPTWQNYYMGIPVYNTVPGAWECVFTPPADAVLGIYSFRFICFDNFQDSSVYSEPYNVEVLNNVPIIVNVIKTKLEVKRTESIKINIEVSDNENNPDELLVNVRYKPYPDQTWQTISGITYSNGQWVAEFIPTKSAVVGNYIFNVTCNDSIDEVFVIFEIAVLNNLPSAPEVVITPAEPRTDDELSAVIAKRAEDIETLPMDIKYWYYWYKNDNYMPEFDNFTTIPTTATKKGQTWRCVVYPFDGDGPGALDVAFTVISNSPPSISSQFQSLEIIEDTKMILEDKLMTVFDDIDNDTLMFNHLGAFNIQVEIIQENGTILLFPRHNWFGKEVITFSASDSMGKAEQTVEIIVRPANDLPVIVQIGSQLPTAGIDALDFIVDEDDTLKLPIIVTDEDGDVIRGMIRYSMNITNKTNLYLDNNELVFYPGNQDVGWHYINVSITDGNETPTEYIHQKIRIQVVNVNDPPTIDIITPKHGSEFSANDKISLECVVADDDLIAKGANEHLTILWSSNHSRYRQLGSGLVLTNLSLPPGFYTIEATVEDSSGASASDSTQIIVKEKPKDDAKTDIQNSPLWLGLLIVLVIIIFIIIIFILVKRKKKKL
ncbi:LamG domain-containing protein, partial [[Eubacterium] cellulosolvens]